jgi:ADP-heptose:LPS heptosyltransferase
VTDAAFPRGAPDILVVRLSSFGDIVLSEPVTRVLKQRYPASRVVFAAGRAYAGLPGLFDSVDRVWAHPPDLADRDPGKKPPARSFDLVVDLQANRRSRGLLRDIRAGRVLTYKRPRWGRFFTVYLPWLWKGPQPRTVETYFRTLRPLGIPYSGETPRLKPPESALAWARSDVGEGPFVGVCPGSSSSHKSWGEKRFVELVRMLAPRRKVLLVGSEDDRPAVEAILTETAGLDVGAYAGTDVGVIASYLALCKTTVTNDSGLMHLAGAVGSRPVAIFGPTSPLLGFAPAAEGAVVLTLGLACSPCSFHGNRACRLDRRYCMEGITPAYVASVVNGMMDAAG